MNFMTNWKTTCLGAGAALTAAGHLLTGFGHGDFSVIATDAPAILAGAALIFAKDGNVTGGTTKQ